MTYIIIRSKMCWSAKVSLETFLFSFGVFVFAYLSGFEPKLLFLYFWFILMQLIEFFLWKNINNKWWNHFFSLIAFGVLLIHPLALTVIISNSFIRNCFLCLYVIFLSLIIYIHNIENDNIKYSVSVAKNGHLSWNWTNHYIFAYLIYLLFFIALLFEKEYIAFIIIFLTYLYSFISYYHEGTFSSIWCWSANILGLFIIYKVIFRKSYIH